MDDYYEIIAQSLKYNNENNNSLMADGVYIKGTELTSVTKPNSIYPLRASPLFNVLELINSYKKRGLNVKLIDFSIEKRPQKSGNPDIGSVLYVNEAVNNAEASVLSMSKTTKNPDNIIKVLHENLNNFIEDMLLVEACADQNITDSIIEYYNNINFLRINNINSNFKDKNKWSKVSEGNIVFSLDQVIMCEKECIHSSYHNNNLSKICGNKPWAFKPENTCSQCGGKMIKTPVQVIFYNDSQKKIYNNVNTIFDDNFKMLLINSFELGSEAGILTRLTLSKELGIDNNIDELLIMPSSIYFSKDSKDYKVVFEKLSDMRFKRTFAKGLNNKLKMKVYEKGL